MLLLKKGNDIKGCHVKFFIVLPPNYDVGMSGWRCSRSPFRQWTAIAKLSPSQPANPQMGAEIALLSQLSYTQRSYRVSLLPVGM